jgi:hypothetical protein
MEGISQRRTCLVSFVKCERRCFVGLTCSNLVVDDNDIYIEVWTDSKHYKQRTSTITSKTPVWNQTLILYVLEFT